MSSNKKRYILTLVLSALVLVFNRPAAALTLDDFISVSDPSASLFFEFCVIEGSGLPNAPQSEIAQLELGLAVTIDGDDILFEFVNASPIASSITDIYFDDSTSRGGSALMNNGSVFATAGSNVNFSVGAGSPPDLPGGQNLNPAFSAHTALSAHAGNPSSSKGINPGENLVLSYEMLVDPSDIAAALLEGALRVGMHVQSIGDSGESDAFIAKPFTFPQDPQDPQNPVPEPATIALLGLGGGLLALRKRWERNS